MKIKYNHYTLFHVHIQLQYRLCFLSEILLLRYFNIYSKATKLLKLKGPKYIEDNDLFYLLNQLGTMVHVCINHLN